MAEKYTRIFTLPEQNASAALNCPVSVEAGALLIDNTLNQVLGQVKFKNNSVKSIKNMTVTLKAFDSQLSPIAADVIFRYENLIADPGSFFGTQTPVYMDDNNAKSFLVEIDSIMFSDGTSWSKINEQFKETAKNIGEQSVKIAKTVGTQGAKSTVKFSALLVNIIFTIALISGEISIIKELISAPSALNIVPAVLLGLATIVSAPGFAKIVFHGNYGKKQRLLKWGIFAAIIILDLIIVNFIN